MSLKEFKISSKLGEGAYSSVYKVTRLQDNQEYALKKVKLINLSDKEKMNALNEVRILASIRHQNIISYKEAFIDENSNSLCICMEYSNNGDLFQRICEYQKKGQLFSEQEIWNVFIQLVKGLKALHDLRIFHRDLKSANVFLNKDGSVKLGDMNVSKVAKKGLLYTQTGTPYYASPEVWKDQPYDSKSDIWSLGCVLYEMTTLKPPFRAEDMEGLFKKVIRGYYPRISPHFSQDLSNVIRALLQVAPHLRPSADKILQLPAIVKRVNDNHLIEVDEGAPFLLNTIRIPKNLSNLTERMPKPNYQNLKTKKMEKHKFLSTVGNPPEIHKSQDNASSSMDKNSIHMLPKIGHKRQNPSQAKHKQQQIQYQQENNDYDNLNNSALQGRKDDSMINSPNKGKHIHGTSSHNKSKEELPDIRANGSGLNQNKNSQNNQGYGINPNRGIPKKKVSDKNVQRQNGAAHMHNDYESQGDSQLQRIKNLSIHNKDQDHQQKQHNNRQYENSKNHAQKNQELRKLLEIQNVKNENKYEQNERQNLHQIYKSKNNKYSMPQNKYKLKQKYNILDIEGESKPLMSKGIGYKVQSQKPMEDKYQRLPQLVGGRLPKIGNSANNMNNQDVMIQGQGGKIMGQEKDGTKIREISKAYKVNIGHLDELKERYRQIKRMENQKKDKQYKDYMSKNTSLPPNNHHSYLNQQNQQHK